MRRQAAPFAFALLSTLALAEPAEQAEQGDSTGFFAECRKPAGSEVVVQALRFSDGRSYAYRVTNNGTSPIVYVTVGWAVGWGGEFIENNYSTEPVSLGSPSGWKGQYLPTPDPRLPESHSPVLARYWWYAEDWQTGGIQPGRSLSGFSVQLPTPQEAELARMQRNASLGLSTTPLRNPPLEERLPPQPDLTDVPFEIGRTVRCDRVGTVELDRGWDASDAPES